MIFIAISGAIFFIISQKILISSYKFLCGKIFGYLLSSLSAFAVCLGMLFLLENLTIFPFSVGHHFKEGDEIKMFWVDCFLKIEDSNQPSYTFYHVRDGELREERITSENKVKIFVYKKGDEEYLQPKFFRVEVWNPHFVKKWHYLFDLPDNEDRIYKIFVPEWGVERKGKT